MVRPLLALVVLGASGPAVAAVPSPASYHIVSHGRPVHPGDHVELRILPAPPAGVLQALSVTTIDGRTLPLLGPYRAPYVVEAGTAPVIVTATLAGEGWQREARTTLELAPGSVIGASDCLGPDQRFVPEYGEIAGAVGDLEDMPRLFHAPAPVREVAAGFAGTVVVRALVCRSGQVLDAYVAPSFRDARGFPVERDPRVVAAAVSAAKRAVFGRGEGAAWRELPVVFAR